MFFHNNLYFCLFKKKPFFSYSMEQLWLRVPKMHLKAQNNYSELPQWDTSNNSTTFSKFKPLTNKTWKTKRLWRKWKKHNTCSSRSCAKTTWTPVSASTATFASLRTEKQSCRHAQRRRTSKRNCAATTHCLDTVLTAPNAPFCTTRPAKRLQQTTKAFCRRTSSRKSCVRVRVWTTSKVVFVSTATGAPFRTTSTDTGIRHATKTVEKWTATWTSSTVLWSAKSCWKNSVPKRTCTMKEKKTFFAEGFHNKWRTICMWKILVFITSKRSDLIVCC